MDRRPPGLMVGRREREASRRRPTCHSVQVLIGSPRPERGTFFVYFFRDHCADGFLQFCHAFSRENSFPGRPSESGGLPVLQVLLPKKEAIFVILAYMPPFFFAFRRDACRFAMVRPFSF